MPDTPEDLAALADRVRVLEEEVARLEGGEEATLRRRCEAEMERQGRLYAALSQVNQLLVRTRERDVLLGEVPRLVGVHGVYGGVWIALRAADDDVASTTSWAASDAAHFAEEVGRFVPQLDNLSGAAGLHVTTDAHPWGAFLQRVHPGSCLALNLRLDGRCVGILGIHAPSPDAFDDLAQRVLAELASDLSYALEALRAEEARQRAEAALRVSEERFRALAENAPDSIARLDTQGRHLYVNPAVCRAIHRPPEWLLGKTHREAGLTPEDCDDWERLVPQVAETGEPIRKTQTCVFGSRTYYFDWQIVPEFGPDGRVSTLLTSRRDITSFIEAQQALARSEREMRETLETISDAFLSMDAEGRITYYNAAAERALGRSRDEVVGRQVVEAFPEALRWSLNAECERVIRQQVPTAFETYVDVSPFEDWFEIRIYPHGDRTAVFLRIITDRKRAEEALRASEQRYRTLFEGLLAGMALLEVVEGPGREPTLRVVEINGALARLVEIPQEEAVGADLLDLLPSTGPEWQSRLLEAARVGTPAQQDAYYHAPSGTYCDVRVFSPEPGKVAVLLYDVTDRIRAEQATHDSELQLRSLLESVGLLAVMIDAQGRITFCNDGFARATGWTREEALGSDGIGFFSPSDEVGSNRASLAHVLTDERASRQWQVKMLTRGGALRTVQWYVAVLRDAADRPTGLAAIGEDVTDRLNLEEQFRQAQKMEALGRLAGGVAHDFNNLLTVISGYADSVLAELGANHPLRDDVEEIRLAGERAAGLTRQLLAFSRRQSLELRRINLNEAIDDMVRLLQRVIGEDVTLGLDLEPDLAPVMADAGGMEQVLVNLAVNGRDAMPNGGTLRIETANVHMGQSTATRHGEVPPGDYVRLTVTDTGEGMPASVQAHLFEPFYTTKQAGHGTGLGLPTVYGIVTQCGGYILVDSVVGEGTTFAILLPTTADTSGAERSGRGSRQAAAGGSETIVVVEDQEDVRRIIARILAKLGYDVLEAEDAAGALVILQGQKPVHLVLTDMVMPGSTGSELAGEIRWRWPQTRVAFMSGYLDQTTAAGGDPSLFDGVLHKPFTARHLATQVRRMLDAPSATAASEPST